MIITTAEFERAIEFAFLSGAKNSLAYILTPLETKQRIKTTRIEAYNIILKEKEEGDAH